MHISLVHCNLVMETLLVTLFLLSLFQIQLYFQDSSNPVICNMQDDNADIKARAIFVLNSKIRSLAECPIGKQSCHEDTVNLKGYHYMPKIYELINKILT